MIISVYTKPNCQACEMTFRHLHKRGITFREAPITDEIIESLEAQDIRSAPIVHIEYGLGEQMWGGYRPDRIDALVTT